ncbi:MAG: ABC transporter substrate binding protein [Gallionellaceae bacterium]
MAKENILLTINPTNSLSSEFDLIVAVGIRSAAIALQTHSPVLCVLVSKAGFEELLRSEHQDKRVISAIYMDQPEKRQIDLLVAAMPRVKKIGLLYSSHPPNLDELRKAIKKKSLILHEQKSESSDLLHQDLQSVLQKSDVLLAIPDANIYNSSTIRHILLETYRRGTPLVGYSPAYVRAGALFAVFSTPEQVAKQASGMTKAYFDTGRLTTPQYPRKFDVTVNRQVANSLGIQIKQNDVLIRKINSAESRARGSQ